MKRFNIIIPKDDGGVEVYPMKEWLRQHHEHIPAGLDATTSTSHQLRNGLKKLGWKVRETESEVQIVAPGPADIDISIDEVFGDEDEIIEDDDQETAFALEYQLRDFIAQNLGAIIVDGKRLQLYVDPAGRDGIEFQTPVGRIDILAKDETGAFIVFELKRARSPDHAIGQVTRYMGWVAQTIGKDQEVHGIIVAKSISDGLRYAVSVVPKVRLFEYEVSFQLNPIFAPDGNSS